jgi:DNA-binding response OmpR family regulator
MPKKILVVDDDVSILRTLKRVLERDGYEVDTSETANEALLKLNWTHYDLALVDVILPDMKGTDLLANAKKALNQTVKFIITGYPTAEVGAKARDLGADAFILKPVKIPELLSVIHVFLEDQEAPVNYNDEKFSLSKANL